MRADKEDLQNIESNVTVLCYVVMTQEVFFATKGGVRSFSTALYGWAFFPETSDRVTMIKSSDALNNNVFL
jgi:hypothetical protein